MGKSTENAHGVTRQQSCTPCSFCVSEVGATVISEGGGAELELPGVNKGLCVSTLFVMRLICGVGMTFVYSSCY